MRAKVVLAACLIYCTPVSSQETICPADYYPLPVGARWTYYDEQGGGATTTTVTGIEAGLFVVEDGWGVRTYWSSDAAGLTVHKFYDPDQETGFQWSYMEPPITRFPYEMEAGRVHSDSSLLNNPGLPGTTAVQFRATFEGIEDHFVKIDVKLQRTYPLCARIVTRQATETVFFGQKIMSTIIESTEWWGWGIGPVEQQMHIVTWDIINGEAEDWITLELFSSNLLEDNPPEMHVTQPTTEPIYGTDADSVRIAGTASDDSRIMRIGWEDDRGHAGLATINGDWQIAAVPLVDGENVVTVTAWDSCGNTTTCVLTVYRISCTSASPSLCHEGEILEGVQLRGSGFPEGALVELRHNEETVAATNVQVSSGGAMLAFDVDLSGSGARSWDVVIRHLSGVELARLPAGFRTIPLAVAGIRQTAGSGVALSWTSIADRSYEVWAVSRMNAEWELADSVPSAGEVTEWEDPSARDSSGRFYRISPVPPR